MVGGLSGCVITWLGGCVVTTNMSSLIMILTISTSLSNISATIYTPSERHYTFVPDTQKPERSSTKEHANYFSRQMDWPKYFRMKFLLKTWRSSLVDATTSNFQKMREKNLPEPLKKIPHLIKVTIYQEVVTFSSHYQD